MRISREYIGINRGSVIDHELIAHISSVMHASAGGSWSSTCKLVSFSSNGLLSVICGLPDNGISSINTGLCAPGTAVNNIQNTLTCVTLASGVPGGSWFETCSPISWSNGVMSAYCGAVSGSSQVSLLIQVSLSYFEFTLAI